MRVARQPYGAQDSKPDGEVHEKYRRNVDGPELENTLAGLPDRKQECQEEQDNGKGARIDRIDQTGADHRRQELTQVCQANGKRPA